MTACCKRSALLDVPGIRRLRYLRGYSIRELGRRLGVSATTVANLEKGANHAELTLRLVDQLAELLGVAVVELFETPRDAAPIATSDDLVVEAALAITQSATSTADLAVALGWELARVRTAVRRLAIRRADTGIRIHDHGWQRHGLRPATEFLSEAQQESLHRIGPRRRGLTIQTASLLARIADGDGARRWWPELSRAQHVALQSLLRQGLVEVAADGTVVLSSTVRAGFFPERAGNDDSPRLPAD